MKKENAERRRASKLLITTWAALLLASMAACVRINVKQTQGSGGQAPPSGSGGGGSGGGGLSAFITGGNFVPVQAQPVSISPGTIICGQTVSTSKVTFTFDVNGIPVPTQIPPANARGFRGFVVDLDDPQESWIPNAEYVLQWFVNTTYNGCAATVPLPPTKQISFSILAPAGSPHHFTAFFLPGNEPPAGHRIRLLGNWTF